MRYVNPETLPEPNGYNNGVVITPPPGGSVLFVAGQIGGDRSRAIVGDGFADQFDQALANVVSTAQRSQL